MVYTPDDHDAPETFCRTAKEFSNLLSRQIEEMIAEREKEAADTGKTVQFAFELVQQVPSAPKGQRSVMRLEFICEPGKPARQVSSAAAAPLDRYGNPIE